MKTQLFTALALGLGALAMAQPTDKTPTLGAPVPYAFMYSFKLGTCSLGVRLPAAIIGNISNDFFGTQLQMCDKNGKTHQAVCRSKFWPLPDCEIGFFCELPEAPTGELVYSGSIRLNTGDAVVASEPLTLAEGQSGEVTLNNHPYHIHYDEKEQSWCLEALADTPAVLKAVYRLDDFTDVSYHILDRHGELGTDAFHFESRWGTTTVQELSLANPRTVDEPVHVIVDTEPMLHLEAAPSADSGLQKPQPDYYQNGSSEQYPIKFQAEYILSPQDENVHFTAMPDSHIPLLAADGSPQNDLSLFCFRRDYAIPSSEPQHELRLWLNAEFPDSAEREISCSGTMQLETARFGEPRIVPLEADATTHELRVSDASFSYNMTRTNGVWYIEYTYAEPDGDEGELFSFGDYVSNALYKGSYTDPEDGRRIVTVSAELEWRSDSDSEDDAPAPALLIHPFTERKSITLPITISGRARHGLR